MSHNTLKLLIVYVKFRFNGPPCSFSCVLNLETLFTEEIIFFLRFRHSFCVLNLNLLNCPCPGCPLFLEALFHWPNVLFVLIGLPLSSG